MVIGLDWNMNDSLGRRNESFHGVARRDDEYVRYFFTVDLQSISWEYEYAAYLHVTKFMKKFKNEL